MKNGKIAGKIMNQLKVFLYITGSAYKNDNRRFHLYDSELDKVLCGFSGNRGYTFYWEQVEISKRYLNPNSEEYIDDYNEDLKRFIEYCFNAELPINLCKRCAKIALNKIKNKKEGKEN